MMVADPPDFSVQDTVHSIDELLALSFTKVEVLLLDLDIPTLRGSDLVSDLTSSYPDLNILAISEMRDPVQLKKVIKDGASGYVFKDRSSTELIDALQEVVAGDRYLCDEALSI
ncbi:MAG: response regulator [Fodinibius sp.]|nr:response regulator [Fodinibius sp.]